MAAISILMPAYNGMQFIQQAVDSVLAQSFTDWELLISDDGSSDGTVDYLRTLADPRIRVFFQERNGGILPNVNFLCRNARAPLCQALCQDDMFIAPDSLGQIVQRWQQLGPEVGVLRVNWGSDASACRLREYGMAVIPSRIDPSVSDLLFFVFGNIGGNLSNLSWRPGLMTATGGFREDLPYAGDFEFWVRAARRTHIALDTRELIFVREHEQQASKTLNFEGELAAQLRVIVSALYERLAGAGLPPRLLKLHATLNYDTLQRDAGVKMALAGRGGLRFLRQIDISAREAVFTQGGAYRWAVWLFSAGGRRLRDSVARRLLRAARRHHAGLELGV